MNEVLYRGLLIFLVIFILCRTALGSAESLDSKSDLAKSKNQNNTNSTDVQIKPSNNINVTSFSGFKSFEGRSLLARFQDSRGLKKKKLLPRFQLKTMDSNETNIDEDQGVKKKKIDKFDKIVDKLHQGRLLKFDGSILVPTLMGILLKVATAIPIILAISTFVGTISLLGSKLALLISAILGVRTLLQYFNMLNPPAREAPPITQSDMMDIQNLIAKQQQISDIPAMPTPPPPTPPPIKTIPLSMPIQPILPPPPAVVLPDLMNAPMPIMMVKAMTTKPTTTTTTTESPPSIDFDHNNYLLFDHPGLGDHYGHYGVTNPGIHVDFGLKDLYHPDNYFAHHPSGAEHDTHNLIHHNQLALDDLHQHHYGAPYYVHGLKRIDDNIADGKKTQVTNLKNIQKFTDKNVVKKLNDLIKKNDIKNVISKVKIVKSVNS